MATRRKPLRKTVERGYGEEHKRLRARLLAAYQPTDPCARCGWPLGPDRDAIQLGHRDDRTGYSGLEHRRCNVAASNRRRARLARQPTATRRSTLRLEAEQPYSDDQPSVWVLWQTPPRQHTRRW
jgi:hypothetical protein